MITVEFVHRTSEPKTPKPGTFYWIDKQDGSPEELWFGLNNGCIRLNKDIVSRLKGLEGDVKNIQEILGGIDLNDFLTSSDLEEINDKINKVNDKLTWQVIK